MRHAPTLLLTFTACAALEPPQYPTGEAPRGEVGQGLTGSDQPPSSPTIHDGEPSQGGGIASSPRGHANALAVGQGSSGGTDESKPTRVPAEMPAPSLLPYGIAPQDPYAQDPNALRACDDVAQELAGNTRQFRGVRDYCKWRSYRARKGVHDSKTLKEPRRWADGSYLHGVDIRAAEKLWHRFNNLGYIDETCELHSRNHAVQMFTRGKWFDVSLYNARHLATTHKIPCWDPAIMDRTDVGARVVVARSIKACWMHFRSPCTKDNLKRWYGEWIP